jgi:all-trans-retinol dehydrogenase (NAD+)
MSNITSIKEGCDLGKNRFGDVHILINNAGIVSGKTTMELDEAEINRTFHVNTISHLHTIREFLPAMKANKKGHIVSIASMAGLIGVTGLPDYCGSKFGAIAIDETLRYELSKSGDAPYVKTTCICPYFINTGMFDGAKASFPMYILDPIRVADRVIAAIRQEEAQVLIPYRGNILYLCRLLPISLADTVGGLLGMHDSMDDFKGRGGREGRMPGLDTKA